MEDLIKWEIDHDCSYNHYLLVGYYNRHIFVKTVLDKFWGIPLMYAKWCITRRYKILYPGHFKKRLVW